MEIICSPELKTNYRWNYDPCPCHNFIYRYIQERHSLYGNNSIYNSQLYKIFIYKGLYGMRVEMKNKNITLISFPFARISIPYKKIKSMEIVDRRWNDYLMGYGCKLKGKGDNIEIYFRSRMGGKVVVIHTRRFKFKRIELTVDSPEDFIEEIKKKI